MCPPGPLKLSAEVAIITQDKGMVRRAAKDIPRRSVVCTLNKKTNRFGSLVVTQFRWDFSPVIFLFTSPFVWRNPVTHNARLICVSKFTEKKKRFRGFLSECFEIFACLFQQTEVVVKKNYNGKYN